VHIIKHTVVRQTRRSAPLRASSHRQATRRPSPGEVLDNGGATRAMLVLSCRCGPADGLHKLGVDAEAAKRKSQQISRTHFCTFSSLSARSVASRIHTLYLARASSFQISSSIVAPRSRANSSACAPALATTRLINGANTNDGAVHSTPMPHCPQVLWPSTTLVDGCWHCPKPSEQQRPFGVSRSAFPGPLENALNCEPQVAYPP